MRGVSQATVALLVTVAFAPATVTADAAASDNPATTQPVPVEQIPVGAWVRVHNRSGEDIQGTLIAIHTESLVMRLAGERDVRIVPLEEVRQLQFATSQRSHAAEGLVLGGAVGAWIALLGGAPCATPSDPLGAAAYLGRYLVPAGAVLGAVVGSSAWTDDWRPGFLPDRQEPKTISWQ
jgi:hypothetical protein